MRRRAAPLELPMLLGLKKYRDASKKISFATKAVELSFQSPWKKCQIVKHLLKRANDFEVFMAFSVNFAQRNIFVCPCIFILGALFQKGRSYLGPISFELRPPQQIYKDKQK